MVANAVIRQLRPRTISQDLENILRDNIATKNPLKASLHRMAHLTLADSKKSYVNTTD
jgi:hypothetical protein